MLDLLHGVHAQIRAAQSDAASITARAILEHSAQIQWLARNRDSRVQYAFLVWSIHEEIEHYERIDPETHQGKLVAERVSRDSRLASFRFSRPDLSRERVAFLRSILETPGYAEAEAEYQRIPSGPNGRRKPLRWYALFDGPRNVEQLFERLAKAGQYELEYRPLSRIVHGSEVVVGSLIGHGEEGGAIVQLAWPRSAAYITMTVSAESLALFEEYMARYCKIRTPEYRDAAAEVARRVKAHVDAASAIRLW